METPMDGSNIKPAVPDQKPPQTPASFIEGNFARIGRLFPGLVKPDAVAPDSRKVLPDKAAAVMHDLTDQIWTQLRSDPAFQELGREEFDKLPPEKQMDLLQRSLNLLEINADAAELLKKLGDH